MHKLTYPTSVTKLEDLKKEYKNSILKSTKINIGEIEAFLNSIGINIPFSDILIMPLEELIKLPSLPTNIFSKSGKKAIRNKKNKIKSYFKYSEFQKSELSKFFMKYDNLLNIKGCCYCGIDFINSYLPFDNDYRDFEHFMQECTMEDLLKIHNIGDTRAKTILSDYKGKITQYTDIHKGIDKDINNILFTISNNFGQLTFDELKASKKNHFTLDHLLPQSEYPHLSLCLFNLVPSCYTCNSKLKKDKKIYSHLDELIFTSPTGLKTINDIIFKIYFKKGFDDKKLPTELNEYSIKIESPFTEYFRIFNLQGRYNFHKDISYELISKRRIYSDSQIKEIFKLFNKQGKSISENEIKTQIFGSDIFTGDGNKPFQKYKKDIARQLFLI